MSKPESSWSCFYHLPGLVMEEVERSFAGGTLRRIPHDEWHAMDESAWQPVDYNDTGPVFYCTTLQGTQNKLGYANPEVVSDVRRRTGEVYRSLALTLGWPFLPSPRLSCGYILPGGGSGSQTFLIGPSGRDWILTGCYRQPRHLLSDQVLAASEWTFKLLTMARKRLPSSLVEAGFQALEIAALPDTSEVYDGMRFEVAFLGCVAAMERLLVPEATPVDNGESITQSFSRNGGALLGQSYDEIAVWSDRFRRTYKLRSDLLHGRLDFDPESGGPVEALASGCMMFLAVLREALLMLVEAPPGFDIPAYLKQVSSSRTAFEEALR